MTALVGRNGHLMRRLVGEVVRSAEDKGLTESQLLEMLSLESIQSLMRKRKLQWVAHCARRGDTDLTWKRVVRGIEDGKSKWVTRLKEDGKELGVKSIRGWCKKVKDRGWLASKLGESPLQNFHRRYVQCSKSCRIDMFEAVVCVWSTWSS